jgi:septum formation inhibitor-activating ATPase MinD
MNHFDYPIGKARYEGRAMRSEALLRRDLLDRIAEQSTSVRVAAEAVVRAASSVVAARNAGTGFVVTDIQRAAEALRVETERLAGLAAEAAK